MVASMITLDPVDRPSFSTILSDYQSITLPDFFYSFFHHFNATLHAPLPSDGSRLSPFARGGLARLGGGPSEPSSIAGSFVGGTGIDGTREDEELPSEGDWRIERLRRDWEGVRVWLDGEMEGNGDGQASDLEDKTPLLEGTFNPLEYRPPDVRFRVVTALPIVQSDDAFFALHASSRRTCSASSYSHYI
jgi:hypothetical protein